MWEQFQQLPGFDRDRWSLVDEEFGVDVDGTVQVFPKEYLRLVERDVTSTRDFMKELRLTLSEVPAGEHEFTGSTWNLLLKNIGQGQQAAKRLDAATENLVRASGFPEWGGHLKKFNWGDGSDELRPWVSYLGGRDLGTITAVTKAYLDETLTTVGMYTRLFGDKKYTVPAEVWNKFQDADWEFARSIDGVSSQVEGLTTMTMGQ